MDFETEQYFQERRAEQDKIVLEYANLQIKRFYTLDDKAYVDGALPSKVKELLGLVSSLVLKCNDCIRYHLGRCHEEGVTDEEIVEALNVGLVVGGSITIPHLRKALQVWHELTN
ncbi:MAG: carboxymuconolactone decarboxylase family protein [Candidatus Thorarchaeota archaeon]